MYNKKNLNHLCLLMSIAIGTGLFAVACDNQSQNNANGSSGNSEYSSSMKDEDSVSINEEKDKPLSKNQPYAFSESVCTVYEGVTMQELYNFIPRNLVGQKFPETVEEFENMVLENIDHYNVAYASSGTIKEIYFFNVFDSIEITDTLCKFVGEESVELPYVQDGNTYSITAGETTILLTYKNNRVSYAIECPELFAVTHYFELD